MGCMTHEKTRKAVAFAPHAVEMAAMTAHADHSPPPRATARQGRDFIGRHGETVFNAARMMQGDHAHTPLTRAGFLQADAMGAGLAEALGKKPAITLWSSSAGRALQTLAIVAEHLDLDWHQTRRDDRLVEIGTGSWGGRSYADIIGEQGNIVFEGTGLLHPSPDGEPYAVMAARLSAWAADTADDPGDRLVIMHGISSRVLRGILTGAADHPAIGVPAAPSVPQGSVVMIAGGAETLVVRGTGFAPA